MCVEPGFLWLIIPNMLQSFLVFGVGLLPALLPLIYAFRQGGEVLFNSTTHGCEDENAGEYDEAKY